MVKNIIKDDIQEIILISDIHFGVRNASIEWSDNIVSYFHNFFFPLIKNIKKDKPNSIIIIAGDYFDNRQALDLNVMNIGIDIMTEMSNILPVYIINGNHDVYKKNDNTINSLKVLRPIKNVKVITENTILITKYHNFLLFPWSGDLKEDTNAMLQFNDIDFAIMHEDIKSFNYDNGRQIVSGFDSNTFKGKKIYSGHIHKRQESEKVTYIGAPYQLRRSDIGNEKGIYVLNVENEEIVENFYKNDYSPKFLKLRVEDIMDITLENLRKLLTNNYVDIIIKRTELNNINISNLMTALDSCSTKKIEIILDNSDVEQVLKETDEITKDLTLNDIVKNKILKLEISDKQKSELLKLNEHYIVAFNESLNE